MEYKGSRTHKNTIGHGGIDDNVGARVYMNGSTPAQRAEDQYTDSEFHSLGGVGKSLSNRTYDAMHGYHTVKVASKEEDYPSGSMN